MLFAGGWVVGELSENNKLMGLLAIILLVLGSHLIVVKP